MQRTADWLLLKACFGAGTKLLAKGPWGQGWREIELITTDDLVASRDENNPEVAVEWKAVEELFQHTAAVITLAVNGREIRTTSEHPFYHAEKGWTAAGELEIGDQLVGKNGELIIVDAVVAGAEFEAVYNLRLADFHTYFVGDDGWGFAAWAQNTCEALHHYVPMFMGSQVPRGSSLQTPFQQIGHIAIHRALNRYLQPLGMMPSRANTSFDIVRNFSKEERLRALVNFYREYQGGTHYIGFIKEIRATIEAELFS